MDRRFGSSTCRHRMSGQRRVVAVEALETGRNIVKHRDAGASILRLDGIEKPTRGHHHDGLAGPVPSFDQGAGQSTSITDRVATWA